MTRPATAQVSSGHGLRDTASAEVALLELGDERQASPFDDCPGALGREGGFGGGEAGGEWSFVEDVGYPAGKVVAGAVTAQDALVAPPSA